MSSNSPSPGYLSKPFSLRYAMGDLVLWTQVLQVQVKEFTLMESLSPGLAAQIESIPKRQPVLQRNMPVTPDTPTFTRSGGRVHYVSAIYDRHYIDFEGGYDAYLSKLSSNRRSSDKRKHKLFVKNCGSATPFWIARTPEDLARFRQESRAVAVKTYQERLWNAAIPDTDAFWAEAEAYARQGALRGYVSYVQDVPVAYALCWAGDESMSLMYLGYDPAHQEMSPGRVLMWHLLEDLCRDGRFRYYDFGEGHAEYKKSLSTHSLLCGNVLHLEDTALNRLRLRLHMKVAQLSRRLGAWLDKHGLKQRIKKLIRRA